MKKSKLLELIEFTIREKTENPQVDKIYNALVGMNPNYPQLAKAIAKFLSPGTSEAPGFTKEQASDFMRILQNELTSQDENKTK